MTIQILDFKSIKRSLTLTFDFDFWLESIIFFFRATVSITIKWKENIALTVILSKNIQWTVFRDTPFW